MKKFLSAKGNSWQLYINKPIAQLLGINSKDYTVNLMIKNKILYVQSSKNAAKENNKNQYEKNLTKRSSGYGLSIPQPILEILDINPETDMLDIDLNNDILSIKKSL